MLQQHLQGDKVWKLIMDWQAASRANIAAREALQRKIYKRLKAIGYPVVDTTNRGEARLYINTAGPLFYSGVLQSALSPSKPSTPQGEIVANVENNAVMYRGNILIGMPTDLEEAAMALKKAYQRVSRLDEVQKVLATQETLKIITEKTQHAIDDILLLDYITGECKVCQRMSRQ
jgi:hypothetical protein